MQNIFVVLHTLLSEGHDITTVVRLGVETSDVGSQHPFVPKMLPFMDAYAPKYQLWVPLMCKCGNVCFLELLFIFHIVFFLAFKSKLPTRTCVCR